VAITRIGVQPIISSSGQAAAEQTYKVGEVAGEGETVSLAVGCTNDLSVEGNCNVIHWLGQGESYRIYKSTAGCFGLIGAVESSIFIDDNILPDTAQQPPEG